MKNYLPILLAALSIAQTGCGGGGGGGGFEGPATVNFQLSPRTIDTGDRCRAELQISDLHPDGVLLKVRYPTELRYVDGSGELRVDGSEDSLVPVALVTEDSDTYLVFSIAERTLGEGGHGTLTFELQAFDTVERATVGIDADVDATAVFDPKNPQFAAEDEIDVTVRRDR
jgi:hypothetical protein